MSPAELIIRRNHLFFTCELSTFELRSVKENKYENQLCHLNQVTPLIIIISLYGYKKR